MQLALGAQHLTGHVDRVHLAVFHAFHRQVHHAYVIFELDIAEVLLVELERGQTTVGVVLLVGVTVFEVHGLRRFAEAHTQDAVDLGEHGTTCVVYFLLRLAFAHELAQLERVLTQHAVEHGVEFRRVLGHRGVGHGLQRHHAVLLDERADRVEVAAVLLRGGEQEVDTAVVEIGACVLDDVLHEEVRLL